MVCKDFQEKLALYLYDEMGDEEQAACDAHLTACAECCAALDEVRRVHQVLSRRSDLEPSPNLVVECRQALDEALGREGAAAGWQGWLRKWIFALAPRPAVGAASALAVLAFGFSAGWTLRARMPGLGPVPNRITSTAFNGSDLEDVRISGISRVVPDPQTGEVHITLDAERRMTLEGSLDDPRIQQVLVYAVKSYDNAGIRRDSLDALRARGDNPMLRQALLYAMRHDRNPGMRLEALNAVRGIEWCPQVRTALLEVLERDTNPGLRVASIEALARHADQEAVPVLTRLSASDPTLSVRLKCSAAIREIEGK